VQKKAMQAQFKALSRHLHEGTEETPESQNSHTPDQDFKASPLEHEVGQLSITDTR
jgi:hypothetical protein